MTAVGETCAARDEEEGRYEGSSRREMSACAAAVAEARWEQWVRWATAEGLRKCSGDVDRVMVVDEESW